MKKIFSIWLTIFVVAAFIITLICSYKIQSKLAQETALKMLNENLNDAEARILHSNNNLLHIKELTENGALTKTRAFSRIVNNTPELYNSLIAFDKAIESVNDKISTLDYNGKLKLYQDVIMSCPEYKANNDLLERLKQDFDVDEVTITNGDGIMVSSIPAEYIGYDMASRDQSNEFVQKLIKNNNKEYVQKPMPNGYLKRIFQYVGVRRLDNKGFVQIGYAPKRLEEAEKLADIYNISKDFRIGNNGKLKISKAIENKEAVDLLNGQRQKTFSKEIDGKPSLCVYRKYGDLILRASIPEDEMFLSRNTVVQSMAIAYFVLFSIVYILISLLLQKVVIRGIYSVNDSLNKITDGDLNETVKVHNTEEFDVLSNGINTTVNALKKAIEAESKRIDAELEIGRTIQNSVLPDDFPDNDKYTIYAMMDTAKEVGGDFYDFFAIDNTHNAMLVADVSGKGITAALFMMNAKALIKELILSGKAPALAIREANLELCENNKARMFLTLFLAILDTETGKMICVNAGHNPPLINRQGVWDYLIIKHSMALGVSNKIRFTEVEVQLEHNDSFFLYTDGVTEAKNVKQELYGEKRLKEFLTNQENNPKTILPALRKDLKDFAGEEPQSDDITMIMGLYK